MQSSSKKWGTPSQDCRGRKLKDGFEAASSENLPVLNKLAAVDFFNNN